MLESGTALKNYSNDKTKHISTTFLAIFRNEITTILKHPRLQKGVSKGGESGHIF